LLFISCLLIYMLNYLLFLSMVHEYAYFVMNIFGKRSISDNGRHWRPLTFQRLTVAVSTVNCYHQQFKLMLRVGYGGCSRGRQADVAVCCPLLS